MVLRFGLFPLLLLAAVLAPMAHGADEVSPAPIPHEKTTREVLDAVARRDFDLLGQIGPGLDQLDRGWDDVGRAVQAFNGDGRTPSLTDAIAAFEEAAGKFNVWAYGALSAFNMLEMSGDETPADIVAMVNVRVKEGDADARFAAGVFSALGIDGPHSGYKPASWFTAAAEQGHPKAMFFLSAATMKSTPDVSLEWLFKAWLLGDDQAQNALAAQRWIKTLSNERFLDEHPDVLTLRPEFREIGAEEAERQLRNGFARSKTKAAAEAILAARDGFPLAVILRDHIRSTLVPDLLAQAEEQARSWKPIPVSELDETVRGYLRDQGQTPRR